MDDHSRWTGWVIKFLFTVASSVVVAIIVGEGRFSSTRSDQTSPQVLPVHAEVESPLPVQALRQEPVPEPAAQGEDFSDTLADLQGEAFQESPGVANESDPVDAVRTYWSALGSNNYSNAWNALSESFKNRNHSGDYSHYVRGHEEMRVCSITVGDTALGYASDGGPIVDAVVWFRVGSKCRASRESFSFYLSPSPDRGWLIDRVVRR